MSEMKASGIQWIGDIPSTWETTKIKYTAIGDNCLFLDGDWIESDVIEDEGIRYFTTGNVGAGFFKEQGDGYISEKTFYDLHCLKVYPGDLMISRLNEPIGRACIIPDSDKEEYYVVAVDNVILRPNNDYNKRYLVYVMNSTGYAEHANLIARGATMHRISRSQLGQFFIPVPSYQEQVSIADYLDECCGRLDGIISDLAHQVETLKAYKKSLITETVTKGLDKDVTKRASKIEWIPELPAHWDEKRLYIVAYVRARLGWRGLTADEYVDEGYAFLSAFNIINDKLVLDEELLNYITQFRYEESPEIKLHNGDVLLVKDGAGLGKCARIDNLPFEAAPNGSLAVITPNERLHYRYLHYFFVGDTFQQRINQIKNGMGVPHLPQGDLRKIVVPLPPISEQIEICDYLDEKCSVIDPLIREKEAQLDSMRKHRSSLIYEYVTGKKRVKEVR